MLNNLKRYFLRTCYSRVYLTTFKRSVLVWLRNCSLLIKLQCHLLLDQYCCKFLQPLNYSLKDYNSLRLMVFFFFHLAIQYTFSRAVFSSKFHHHPAIKWEKNKCVGSFKWGQNKRGFLDLPTSDWYCQTKILVKLKLKSSWQNLVSVWKPERRKFRPPSIFSSNHKIELLFQLVCWLKFLSHKPSGSQSCGAKGDILYPDSSHITFE